MVGALLVVSVLTPWPALLLQAPLVVDETPQASDVIIVLGSGVRRGPDPIPTQAKDRLGLGAELFKHDLAPNVIITGGLSKKAKKVEADIMAPFLEHLHVPAQNIILERGALSTYDNARYSKEIMDQHDWKRALVVTSAYHTFRSCRVFRKLAIEVGCVPVKLDDHGSMIERALNMRSVVREYAAIVLYWGQSRL